MARGTRSTKKSGASSSTKDKLEKNLAEKMEQLEVEKKAEAEKLKEEGNQLFSAGDNLGAVEKFSEAIEADSSNHVLFSNRSAANLNLMRTRDAVQDADMCVRLKPQWAKGYSRLGAALLADKQAVKSLQAYRQGLKIDPVNAALLQGVACAEPAAKIEEELEAKKAEEARLAAEAEAAATAEAEPVIGIDLGTTYSCVAVWGKDGVEILTDEDGARTVPSYVGWTASGERLIGHRAKVGAAKNVKGTVFDAKRIIGQRMNDEAVRAEAKTLPFSIIEGEDMKPVIEIETRAGHTEKFAPEEISAMVLGRMKQIAEKRLDRPVKKAVITVPAYFNDAQRQATKNAGFIAGLDVLRIINEPTAAALAYGLDQSASSEKGSNILIFDLGGGTFDVSVLRIEGGVFEVKATGGDTRLGGEDFDNTFLDWLVTEFKNKQKVHITDPKDLRKLRAQAEKAKREMSSQASGKVELVIDGEDLVLDVPRTRWEQLNSRLFNQTLDTVKKVLKDAKLDPSEIDDIVLVGGSTRVPRIQELLSEFFGGRQLCRSINPDEAVAYGAAVQGAILSGVRHSACEALVLVDVTPLSLGVEVEGKHMSVIIPRNTAVPCTKKDNYTTTEDYEESLHIRIFEGERPNTSSNHLLGEFEITGIERAKRGEPNIEVTFALDSNGILNVHAIDLKTGVKAECTISDACKGLSQQEMDRMVAEAERFAKEDAELVRKVQLKSEIESLAFDARETDKHLSEETLDWLDTLDLATCPLATLEARHKELERL